jgi:pyruvate carboxylase
MAGLCKPYAAEKLVTTLKSEVGIPVHFHTHDMSGVQGASILKGAEQRLDIVDAALAPMSGMTSQPNLNSIVEALRHLPRSTGLDPGHLKSIAYYWEKVREFYVPFESAMKVADVDIYLHEMPGGQATNLYQQAASLGLGNRWNDLCRMYADVNELFGDIVKVTPTSKAVGDMALFLLANNLKADDVLDPSRELAFPESVVDLMAGRMGQPPGGFPPRVRKRILRDQKAVRGRPGASLPPADFEATAIELEEKLHRAPLGREVVSYLLYPRVFDDFVQHTAAFSDTSVFSTPTFFYGLESGAETSIDIEPGKTLIIKFLTISDPHPDGHRTVFFELNGQPREVNVIDRSLEPQEPARPKADPSDPMQVAAPMPGLVVTIGIQPGDKVTRGQKLATMEAMKMETTIYAEIDGRVAELLVKPGVQVETGELLIRLDRPV